MIKTKFLPLILMGGGLAPLITISCNFNKSTINQNSNKYFDLWKITKEFNPNNSDAEISRKVNERANEIGLYYYKDWINSLTTNPWELGADGFVKNLFCTSERQAIALYGICWGHFWNIALHNQKEPENQMVHRRFINVPNLGDKQEIEVRGSDWKILQKSLLRAKTPFNITVYHGVEFMEIEFWDQLKNFITYDEDTKKYDYSNTVGKELHSYGFLSTTVDKQIALNFSNGNDWTTENLRPPLKESAIFKINIRKNTSGVGYISGFPVIDNLFQGEAQYLIKANSKFIIKKVSKEKDINVFEMDMI